MKIKIIKYSIELNQSDLNWLEEELFRLKIWDDDRNNPLNRHHIQKGDFPLLEKIWEKIKGFKEFEDE